MAKFLTTTGTSFYIEEIITKAESDITIVTPYLKLNKILVDRLIDTERKNISITIIYGKEKLQSDQKVLLDKFKNIQIYYCANLHAKCYFNEKQMIISSMNLYEFSEKNNREMSVLINNDLDKELFTDTLEEVLSIKTSSINESKIVKDSKSIINIIASSHTSYKEVWNAYYPELFRKLSDHYPELTMRLEKEIDIFNFPQTGINVNISGRIDFKFSNKKLYDYYKLKNIDKNNEILPFTRYYWNYLVLNVYPPKDFNSTDSSAMSEFAFNVIRVIDKNWKY